MGIKDELLSQLPKLALMAMAGKAGGLPAVSAFMGGQRQGEFQQGQLQRQAMLDQRLLDSDGRAAGAAVAVYSVHRADDLGTQEKAGTSPVRTRRKALQTEGRESRMGIEHHAPDGRAVWGCNASTVAGAV